MIEVICCSKDRPLQLHAYLESLMYFSNIKSESIYVLYKEAEAIPYDSIIHNFPDVMWIKEHDFFSDLMDIITRLTCTHILWGADDVVIKDYFNLDHIESCFDDPSLLCFSLRYGTNLVDRVAWNSLVWQDDSIAIFDRTELDAYPWDNSATAYRKSDVLKTLQRDILVDERILTMPGLQLTDRMLGSYVPISQFIINPNRLEWVVYEWRNFEGLNHIACYDTSRSIIFFVNRVQEMFINYVDGRRDTDVESLYQAYLAGKRLDWRSLKGWQNKYTHEDSTRFVLI